MKAIPKRVGGGWTGGTELLRLRRKLFFVENFFLSSTLMYFKLYTRRDKIYSRQTSSYPDILNLITFSFLHRMCPLNERFIHFTDVEIQEKKNFSSPLLQFAFLFSDYFSINTNLFSPFIYFLKRIFFISSPL